MVLIYLTHQTNVRDSSAEGAALNSHGRKAVAKRHLRGPRPEGPALGSEISKCRTFGALNQFLWFNPRPYGRGYLMPRLRRFLCHSHNPLSPLSGAENRKSVKAG